MKFIVSLFLIAALSYVFGIYQLPWWFIAVAGFLISILIPQKPFYSFLSGFIALFLLWGTIAVWVDQANDHILSVKIAGLFQLGDQYYLLIILSAFIGGLTGAMGALSGSLVSTALKK